jgi:hypothetical protein
MDDIGLGGALANIFYWNYIFILAIAIPAIYFKKGFFATAIFILIALNIFLYLNFTDGRHLTLAYIAIYILPVINILLLVIYFFLPRMRRINK